MSEITSLYCDSAEVLFAMTVIWSILAWQQSDSFCHDSEQVPFCHDSNLDLFAMTVIMTIYDDSNQVCFSMIQLYDPFHIYNGKWGVIQI